MFVRKKKYPSGYIGVIVFEKIGGKMKELATIAYNEDELENVCDHMKIVNMPFIKRKHGTYKAQTWHLRSAKWHIG